MCLACVAAPEQRERERVWYRSASSNFVFALLGDMIGSSFFLGGERVRHRKERRRRRRRRRAVVDKGCFVQKLCPGAAKVSTLESKR